MCIPFGMFETKHIEIYFTNCRRLAFNAQQLITVGEVRNHMNSLVFYKPNKDVVGFDIFQIKVTVTFFVCFLF
jgi:hypothetical protein